MFATLVVMAALVSTLTFQIMATRNSAHGRIESLVAIDARSRFLDLVSISTADSVIGVFQDTNPPKKIG